MQKSLKGPKDSKPYNNRKKVAGLLLIGAAISAVAVASYQPVGIVPDLPLPDIPAIEDNGHPDYVAPVCVPMDDGRDGLGQLRVVGPYLVDESCDKVMLKGVAITDPKYWGYGKPDLRDANLKSMSEDWHAKVVEIPVFPGRWKHEEGYLEKHVDPLVEKANENGMYVLFTWMGHGNPITGETEKVDWKDDWPDNPLDPSKDLAIAGLTDLASRYKGNDGVLYSIMNEPVFLEWDGWRPVAEELVDAVHLVDPEAVVLVAGVDWGYDLSGVVKDPVDRPNVVYETHPYPWKDRGWKSAQWKEFIPKVAERHPVFLGEWAFGPENWHEMDKWHAEGRWDEARGYGKELTEMCEQKCVGWTAWSWDPDMRTSLINSYYDPKPTFYGNFVRKAIIHSERDKGPIESPSAAAP